MTENKNSSVVRMIFPQGHIGAFAGEDGLITAMRLIAVAFGTNNEWSEKYGCRYENDVFYMCPDYQDAECVCGYADRCEAWHAANNHDAECYHTAIYAAPDPVRRDEDFRKALCEKHGIPWNNGYASMVHCTCDWGARWEVFRASDDHEATCPIGRPNFLYKPTGFSVEWYKYIGRSMQTKGAPTDDMLARIFASHPSGMTLEQAVETLRARTEATQRQWEWMFSEEGRAFGREMLKHSTPIFPRADDDGGA